MEKLEGNNLMNVLREDQLSFKRVAELLQQILGAVQQMHNYRLIHRDIKPDNFHFDHDGNLKLIDVCGMICHLSESSWNEYGQNAVCGTLVYMSPEALKGAGRQAADMWAVGCTLHLMLVGMLPFDHAETVEEALIAVEKPLDFTGR